MVDRPTKATDRISEPGQVSVSVTTAGLDPSSQSFNNDYRAMLERFSGEDVSSTLMNSVEEQLNKKGINLEDVSSDPEQFQGAIAEALEQAKNGLDQAGQAAQG